MKKNLIRILSIFIIISSCIQILSAQDNVQKDKDEIIEGKLRLVLKPYADKIVLRWGIDNSTAWMILRQCGVKIDRIELDEFNKPLGGSWQTITPQAIKPWTSGDFQAMVSRDSLSNPIWMVGQSLFGTGSFNDVSASNLTSIEDAGLEFDNKFMLAFMAADMDPKAAEILGVRYEDKMQVKSTHKYAYKVYPAEKLPDIFKIDTAFYITKGSLKDELHSPRYFSAEGKDHQIFLTLPRDPIYNTYSTYYFERSIDGRNFAPIHSTPIAFNQLDSTSSYLFTDSVDNYTTYYYRVRGKDAFGDMSQYSNVASAMGINQNAPPNGQLYSSINGTEVTLRWIQEAIENRPIAGFIVRRGDKYTLLNEYLNDKLLPPTQFEFKDSPPKLTAGVYYQVLAVDTSGNYSGTNVQFVFAYDSIPPAAPVGMYAKVDTSGVVRLSWKADKADNIQGYRIFTAHSEIADFSPINSDLVRDTVFIDTLDRSVLNKKVYYKFVAIDANNNHSTFSDILVVERPKRVKTPAPVIRDYIVQQNAVTFEWNLPSADDNKSIKILRRPSKDTIWNEIADLPLTTKSYKDDSVQESRTYDYAVVVLDDLGRWSEISYPLSVYVYANEVSVVEEAKMIEKDNKKILTWKLNKKNNPEYFVLYRDIGEGLEQFESVKGEDRQIVLENEKSKKFGIRVIYGDQRKSEIKMF